LKPRFCDHQHSKTTRGKEKGEKRKEWRDVEEEGGGGEERKEAKRGRRTKPGGALEEDPKV